MSVEQSSLLPSGKDSKSTAGTRVQGIISTIACDKQGDTLGTGAHSSNQPHGLILSEYCDLIVALLLACYSVSNL